MKSKSTTTTAEPDAPRDKHGVRTVPPPPLFNFDELAGSGFLTEIETAALLRLSRSTLAAWRKQHFHALEWTVLPNNRIRYRVSAIRAYLALAPKRKTKSTPAAGEPKSAPPPRRSRRTKASDALTSAPEPAQ